MASVKRLGDKRPQELGLHVLRKTQRPLLPSTVDRLLTIPGRHGAYDFGADMGPRPFDLECAFLSRNAKELQQRISDLAMHLTDAYGRPRTIPLIFSAQPERQYWVRYAGTLPIERVAGLGLFTLPMVAFDPFAQLIVQAHEITLDQDSIFLDNDQIRLGDEYSFTVNGTATVEVNNIGSMALRPKMLVSGAWTTFSITANGRTCTYNETSAGQSVEIDGQTFTVKSGGTNKLGKMSGEFVELQPGVNAVTIAGTGLIGSVSFIFTPKFI